MQIFFDKVLKTDGCWIWQGGKLNGYGFIQINYKRLYAHRLSYMIHKGDIPKGLLVCHSCDNPICVNPGHLWLGTKSDNSKDMWSKQRNVVVCGEHHPHAKLTEDDVVKIRQLSMQGLLNREIAAIFNVHLTRIDAIKRHKSWKHVK